MVDSHDRSDGARSRADNRSFAADLLAWLPIGLIVGRAGIALVDAVTTLGSISQTGALVIVLCLTVGIALLARDFDPTLLASSVFFVLAAISEVTFVLAGRALGVTGSPLSAWETVGVRSLAVAFAVVIVFTAVGRRGRRWTRQCLRSLLKLPPRTPPGDA